MIMYSTPVSLLCNALSPLLFRGFLLLTGGLKRLRSVPPALKNADILAQSAWPSCPEASIAYILAKIFPCPLSPKLRCVEVRMLLQSRDGGWRCRKLASDVHLAVPVGQQGNLDLRVLSLSTKNENDLASGPVQL